jgi:predicted MFS family arabinose efflux permease
VILLFVGHNAFFNYLRPFLEAVVGWNLRLTRILVPVLMSVLAVALVMFGSMPLVTAVLVALWGFAFSIIPVG